MNSTPVVAALIERTSAQGVSEILIFRRGPQVRNPGEWEFPGGKIEANESPETALSREIQEELGIQLRILSSLGEEFFTISDRRFSLRVFRCHWISGEIQLTEHDQFQWVRPQELDLQQLSKPDRPFIARWVLQQDQGSK